MSLAHGHAERGCEPSGICSTLMYRREESAWRDKYEPGRQGDALSWGMHWLF